MIVFIKAINRCTAVKHNAEHTDMLKKQLKTVFVHYTVLGLSGTIRVSNEHSYVLLILETARTIFTRRSDCSPLLNSHNSTTRLNFLAKGAADRREWAGLSDD